MLEPPESLKSIYYIINILVKSLRLVNQQETIFIIVVSICFSFLFKGPGLKYIVWIPKTKKEKQKRKNLSLYNKKVFLPFSKKKDEKGWKLVSLQKRRKGAETADYLWTK